MTHSNPTTQTLTDILMSAYPNLGYNTGYQNLLTFYDSTEMENLVSRAGKNLSFKHFCLADHNNDEPALIERLLDNPCDLLDLFVSYVESFGVVVNYPLHNRQNEAFYKDYRNTCFVIVNTPNANAGIGHEFSKKGLPIRTVYVCPSKSTHISVVKKSGYARLIGQVCDLLGDRFGNILVYSNSSYNYDLILLRHQSRPYSHKPMVYKDKGFLNHSGTYFARFGNGFIDRIALQEYLPALLALLALPAVYYNLVGAMITNDDLSDELGKVNGLFCELADDLPALAQAIANNVAELAEFECLKENAVSIDFDTQDSGIDRHRLTITVPALHNFNSKAELPYCPYVAYLYPYIEIDEMWTTD